MINIDETNNTLPKCVLRNGKSMPGEIAMRRKTLGIWNRITWGEVLSEVQNIAAGLLSQGLASEPCIAILGHNEPELFWAEYAIQSVGRAAVCLYPDASSDEIITFLENCKARVVFAEDQEQCDKLAEIAVIAGLERIIYWDSRGMNDYKNDLFMSFDSLTKMGRETLAFTPSLVEQKILASSPEDLAIVVYTSGTTGNAKGVMSSHRSLLDCALRWNDVLDPRPGANYVSYISPAWATEQFLGLSLGVLLPMTINFPEDPETVTSDTREIGAEFLFFSPRQWEAIVSSTESKIRNAGWLARTVYRWGMKSLTLDRRENKRFFAEINRKLAEVLIAAPVRDRLGFKFLKTAVNSGSVLSPEVFDLFHALGVSLRNVYGFTEVGIVTATRGEQDLGTVGKLLTSRLGVTPLEIRIQKSEIQVRGGVASDGYYGQPGEMEAEKTADGWMCSGDAGYFDENGSLVYLDRLDDLRLLVTGQTIAPQFIETRIRLSPYIRDVIAVGDATRSFVGAMVDIDIDLVGKWAEERKISFSAHADLSQKPEVLKLIGDEIERVNKTLPTHLRVNKFVNLFKSFDADEGELTRSRKIRRTYVEHKYSKLISAIYSDAKFITYSVDVKLQDGRTRVVEADVCVYSVGNLNSPETVDLNLYSSKVSNALT